jgi:predicted MPP superfamily phosphohydrolase
MAGKAYYDTNVIEIKRYKIGHSSLGGVLAGLKVVQLSDLHIKVLSDREKKVLDILAKEKPDLVFLTGDYIKAKGLYSQAQSFFAQIKAPLGVYAVMGNTDYYNENGSCILCHDKGSKKLHEKPHPVFLRNSQIRLNVRGKALTLLGVDDPVNKRSELKPSVKNSPGLAPSIVLAHSPEIFSEAADLGINLVLSGHTHGGQLGIIKYLKNIVPHEPALEFLEGFFLRGKTLMYVNRGLGTSYFPFRLGTKPEMVIFTFEAPPVQSGDSNFQITSFPSKTILSGVSLVDFWETFNFLDLFRTEGTPSQNTKPSPVLFDFESPADLQKLNWECHKWFELVKEHATSGRYSLKVSLPPGQYPGIVFKNILSDWSAYAYLNLDVYNPSQDEVPFHVRIDDHNSKWEYANRFDHDLVLKPGPNLVSIPTNSIRRNLDHQKMNLQKVRRLIVFVPNNLRSRDLFIDNIRLN